MKTDHLAEFRWLSTQHNVWPILYPEPEELPILFEQLSSWMVSWLTHLSLSQTCDIDDFSNCISSKVRTNPCIYAWK